MATGNAYDLYWKIKNYITENDCRKDIKMTAGEWNSELGTSYFPATFTSAVNSGFLEKFKYYKANSYRYGLLLTETDLEEIEREISKKKKEKEIETAKKIIETHNDRLVQFQEEYNKDLEEAEENLKIKIEVETSRYNNALALIEELNKE